MKTFERVCLIVIVILFAVCAASPFVEAVMQARAVENPLDHVYSRLTVVTKIDEENDLVYVEDCNGFAWSFYGIDDWYVGDAANITFHDNGTDLIFDDVILHAKYERPDLLAFG